MLHQSVREEIGRIFADANAIISGDHFVYAKKPDGWYHGSDYVNKDAIYPRVKDLHRLCEIMAFMFEQLKIEAEAIVGPTVGGVCLSRHLAMCYQSGRALAIFAEEEDIFEDDYIQVESDSPLRFKGRSAEKLVEAQSCSLTVKVPRKVGTRRVLRRGYAELVKGRRCIVGEDVVNSGLTVIKTVDAIRQAGGEVVAVGALCNRSGSKVTAEMLGVPMLHSLLNIAMPMYREEECPICQERGVLSVRTDLGKGKEFLERIGQQP